MTVCDLIKKHKAIAILLSAVLTALPLNIPGLFLLSFLSLTPLFIVLADAGNAKSAWRYTFLFGLVYHLAVYKFIFASYPLDFAGIGRTEAFLLLFAGWVALSVIHALVTSIAALLFRAASGCGGIYRAAVFAAVWVADELVFSIGKLGFEWCPISLAQYENLPILQLSGFFGAPFISFILAFCSALIGELLLNKSERNKFIAVLLLTVVLSHTLGAVLLILPGDSSGEIRVAAVQGNIAMGEKWTGSDTLGIYSELTREVDSSRCDLVIWPETAVALEVGRHPELEDIYSSLSEEIGCPILMGVLGEKDGLCANAVKLYDGSTDGGSYFKQKLVPFGEFLPFRGLFERFLPDVVKLNSLEEDYYRGIDSKVIDFRGRGIGCLVCFDSIDADLARRSAKGGAEVIVLVTNDSWYDGSSAIRQHFAHSVFRAVENGKSVVRSANTGITAVVSPTGQVTESLPYKEAGIMYAPVLLNTSKTLYTLIGDLFAYGCVIFILANIIYKKVNKSKSSENKGKG